MKKKTSYRICAFLAAFCWAALSAAACGADQSPVNNEALSLSDEEAAGADDGFGEKGGDAENEPVWEAQGDIVAASAQAVNAVDLEGLFTERDLEGGYNEAECVRILLSGSTAECDNGAVSIDKGLIVISAEGVYLLSGTLDEGMVIVEAPETAKVQLVLAGAAISDSSNAAIYVRSADKVFVTLAEGTVNRLENGGSYASIDDNNIDGVIFSKCDLTINGSGSLQVLAAAGHGIVSKDDLKVTGGNVSVTAVGHGLSGKDSVRIADGTLSIVSGKDGIQSDHDTNEEKGYVYIGGGELTLVSDGDGISASTVLQIDGGSFAITAGGGSTNKTAVRNDAGEILSTKGIKGGRSVVINGGSFMIDAQDDALHSNADLMVNGGTFQIATGDDGLHGDETTTVAGGYLDISTSYEGIEGNNVVISGGFVRLYASDDGINAAGGRDQSGFGGFFGRDGFGGGSDSSLLVSGGTVYVNAEGDGMDSNGSLTVTGGQLYISGPSSSGDGALDYEGTGQITGGTVVAVGNSGMAMNFGATSTQGSILLKVPAQPAGAEILVQDQDGQTLLSYTAESAFDSVVVSCPEMVQGESYTILAGDSEQTVTLEELIYGDGMSGFGGRGGFGGGPGGRGGMSGNPQDLEEPEGGRGHGGMSGNPQDMKEPNGGRGPEGMPGNPQDLEEPEGGRGLEGMPGNPQDLEEPEGGRGPEGMPGNPQDLEEPEGGRGYGGMPGSL